MPSADDPVSATLALASSARERIRLSQIYSGDMRNAYEKTLMAIYRSQETIYRNELSMTPQLALLVRHKRVDTPNKTEFVLPVADEKHRSV